MARTTQTRKRSRGFSGTRFAKRRRVFRRRRRRGRLQGYTSRNSAPTSIANFRTRKTRTSVYRRRLWNSTQDKSHYRSILASTVPVSTPTNLTTATLTVINPGNNFWTAAGGAVSEDTGVPVPTFSGDIIFRGGVSKLTVANRTFATEATATDCVRVTIFTVWNNMDLPGFSFPTTVPISWDPSCFPDFQRNGKVIGRKEAILQASGEVVEVVFRHKIQRIDQNVYTNFGNRLAWFVLVSQCSDSDIAVAEVVDITTSHSYSFSADAQ